MALVSLSLLLGPKPCWNRVLFLCFQLPLLRANTVCRNSFASKEAPFGIRPGSSSRVNQEIVQLSKRKVRVVSFYPFLRSETPSWPLTMMRFFPLEETEGGRGGASQVIVQSFHFTGREAEALSRGLTRSPGSVSY